MGHGATVSWGTSRSEDPGASICGKEHWYEKVNSVGGGIHERARCGWGSPGPGHPCVKSRERFGRRQRRPALSDHQQGRLRRAAGRYGDRSRRDVSRMGQARPRQYEREAIASRTERRPGRKSSSKAPSASRPGRPKPAAFGRSSCRTRSLATTIPTRCKSPGAGSTTASGIIAATSISMARPSTRNRRPRRWPGPSTLGSARWTTG